MFQTASEEESSTLKFSTAVKMASPVLNDHERESSKKRKETSAWMESDRVSQRASKKRHFQHNIPHYLFYA